MNTSGVKYEDAYAKAFQFSNLIEGMMQDKMVEETAELMGKGLKQGMKINVIINNRAGGNAPLIGQQIANFFLSLQINLS